MSVKNDILCGFCISIGCCCCFKWEGMRMGLGGESKSFLIRKKNNKKENNKWVRLHLSTYLYQAVEMSNI